MGRPSVFFISSGTSGSSCLSNPAPIPADTAAAIAFAAGSGTTRFGVCGDASRRIRKFCVQMPSRLGWPNDVRGAAYAATETGFAAAFAVWAKPEGTRQIALAIRPAVANVVFMGVPIVLTHPARFLAQVDSRSEYLRVSPTAGSYRLAPHLPRFV